MTASAGTLTLTEFLTARLDEDEAVALSARWHAVDYNNSENEAHGQRWDPARVLAEVGAKRRIVEKCAGWWLEDQGSSGSVVAGRVLRALASVYASHPDYREEWRP